MGGKKIAFGFVPHLTIVPIQDKWCMILIPRIRSLYIVHLPTCSSMSLYARLQSCLCYINNNNISNSHVPVPLYKTSDVFSG